MNRLLKAVYLFLVAIIVFTGVLMIAQGAKEHQDAGEAVPSVVRTEPEASPARDLFENEEGSAL